MYQPQQQQQSSTAVLLQPTGPVQPGTYIMSTSPPVSTCESYQRTQSMFAGIALIVAGVLASVFNIGGLTVTDELLTFIGHGFWCGAMVS